VNGTQPYNYVESVDDADLQFCTHTLWSVDVKYMWLGARAKSLLDCII